MKRIVGCTLSQEDFDEALCVDGVCYGKIRGFWEYDDNVPEDWYGCWRD